MKRPDITPGPWIPELPEHGFTDPIGANGERPCFINNGLKNREANARAITAVPEMLEALEVIDEAFSKLPDYGEPFTRPNGWQVQPMAKVRSALLKAGYTF